MVLTGNETKVRPNFNCSNLDIPVYVRGVRWGRP